MVKTGGFSPRPPPPPPLQFFFGALKDIQCVYMHVCVYIYMHSLGNLDTKVGLDDEVNFLRVVTV